MRNKVVLPAPFGPITPTMPPGGNLKVEIVDQQIVAKALGQVIEIDHVLTEPLGHRNGDLCDRVLLGIGDLEQFLVALIARLGLGLPRLRRG